VEDRQRTQVFPSSTSNAFTFMPGGYVRRDTLAYGTGYWLTFPSPQTVNLLGFPRVRDSIAVSAGWNMIGTISDSVRSTAVVQIPPTIVASLFFKYATGYVPDSVLQPACGYWVKTSAPGLLVLSSASSSDKIGSPFHGYLDRAGLITFWDGHHSMQNLYVTSDRIGKEDLDFFALPPLPPSGLFDVRFATGRVLESTGEGDLRTIPILTTSAEYPLTIAWDTKGQPIDASLVIGTRAVTIDSKGSVTANDPKAAIALRIGGRPSLPKEFGLLQNFPNPFNPSTTIAYDLPRDTRVTLKLYDILGREVTTLVNEDEKAGHKTIAWSSEDVASGVYYYRLQAGEYVSTRKMILLR
jgi:hypothetical protein